MKIYILNKFHFSILICSLLALSLFLVSTLSPSATSEKLLPIYSVETEEKVISITFDSAWTAEDIPLIVSALSEFDCPATFFVVGSWAEKYPESVKLLYESGHEIAGHSYNHAHYNSLSKDDIVLDVKKCDAVIEKITGKTIPIFRSPYGEYNNTVVEAVESLNKKLIQWDVDSLDWKNLTLEEMEKRIFSKVKNGSIILFHNGTEHTASALPSILKKLKDEGYSFKKVSDLIYLDNYYIDNQGRQIKK